jgi:GH25 family lysozyme M1 (1,4-beta-N-acetylmuramidase)
LCLSGAALAVALAAPAYADNGPDVSSWQHPNGLAINWSQVRSDGHTFAIVKATEGPTGGSPYTNPYFAADWAAVRANGMYRGAYHFAQPALPAAQSATDQASYFISAVGNTSEGGDLPPALDLEVTNGLSPDDLIAWTQAFVSTVQSMTGRKPLIYFSPNFWKTNMKNTTAFNSYPLWIADWNGGNGPTLPLPGGWSSYTFWQYTSSGSVAGIQGRVDLSQYCCDPASLTALAYGAAKWAGWYSLGGSAAGRVAVGTNGDGRLEGFARGPNGTISHIWQTSAGAGWSSWYSLNGIGAGDPQVATNRDGRLEAFVVGTNGQLYHAWQVSPSGGWTSWYSLGGSFAGRPSVVVNGDGRLEAIVGGTDSAVWHVWQVAPGSGWTQPYTLGGSTTNDPAAATNADGRLEVFARRADQKVWHSWQVAPGSGWGNWYSLGGTLTGTPAATTNTDGRLEVFSLGADHTLYHAWQTLPSGGWFQFSSFGGSFSSDPVIAKNADSRLEIFLLDGSGQVAHAWQVAPGRGWVPFATLSGFIASSPPGVGTNADGRLELLVRGTDNTVWHAWQTARNGGL